MCKYAFSELMCRCPANARINKEDWEFLKDQASERKQVMGSTVDKKVEKVVQKQWTSSLSKRRKLDNSETALNPAAPEPSTSSEPPTAAEPSSSIKTPSTSPPTTHENTPASTDWESESSETRPLRKMDRFCESVARAGTSVDNAINHVNEALVDIFGPKKARKYLLKRGQIRYQMEKHGDERVAEHLTRMTQQVYIGFDGKINLIKQHNRRAVKREVITIVAYPTEKYLKHFNSNSAK
ncbi:hypothetical protein Ciccas_013808 [Cichlidogyrus casuarinus]|uniref:Uncharacterized protein n=1 Tax=Cichlidogyrus casuarinus TaxID=1844966 RepID=A0ABD2PJL6_9PLAT